MSNNPIYQPAGTVGNNPLYDSTSSAEVVNNPLYQGSGTEGSNPLHP